MSSNPITAGHSASSSAGSNVRVLDHTGKLNGLLLAHQSVNLDAISHLGGDTDLMDYLMGCAPSPLYAFLDEESRSQACANSRSTLLPLTPIDPDRIAEASENDVGIGVPFGHPHFGPLANLIAGPRIAYLCDEARQGGSDYSYRDLAIAGAVYTLHVWLDSKRGEVLVDPAFSGVSEHERNLTALWLQARLETALVVWGMPCSA